MKKYTIKSTSEDGIYYLVNGWNKWNSFWEKPSMYRREMAFSTVGSAKSSLTKLLKAMPEYKTDLFELVEI